MKALIGLGNPGQEYQNTRHNTGFKLIDAIAAEQRILIKKNSFSSMIGVGKINSREVILVKPVTYMNLSGSAVKSIISSRRLALSEVLIICDDVNLPVGSIRLRAGGSDGGHNGLKSVSASLASSDYPRLRIGTGEDAAARGANLASFVLAKPKKKVLDGLETAIARAKEAAYMWLDKDMAACMNLFNEKIKEQRPKR